MIDNPPQWQQALSDLRWLFTNNPELNPSIYIEGVKCAEELMKLTEDTDRIGELTDSALWMYDQRIRYFGDEASVMDRKAYAAFKYFYKTPAKYPELITYYDRAFELNGNAISTFNLVPYMTVAKYAYEWNLPEMPAEKVLAIHAVISEVLDAREQEGEQVQETRDKVDAFLSSLDGILTCEFIEEQLVPRFDANPDDLGLAKKIFNYSLQARCSDQPYFLTAAELIIATDPNYRLAEVLGDKYFLASDFSKAANYYSLAATLTSEPNELYDMKLRRANCFFQLGNKEDARSLAQEATRLGVDASKAYELIGDLYMRSFEQCALREDMVMDRAVFIAAYDMYKIAGSTARMSSAKQQFPSIEEIFENNYEEGQEVTVGCWINETVILQRR